MDDDVKDAIESINAQLEEIKSHFEELSQKLEQSAAKSEEDAAKLTEMTQNAADEKSKLDALNENMDRVMNYLRTLGPSIIAGNSAGPIIVPMFG